VLCANAEYVLQGKSSPFDAEHLDRAGELEDRLRWADQRHNAIHVRKYRKLSFLTLGGAPVAREAGPMTSGQNMPAYAWSTVENAPVRELFPGIRLRPL
jgi:hypothetical protein